MRKFYLMFLALFAMALTANAGTKVLYSQDFETAIDAAAAGWASPNVPGGLSIGSDEYGKFFQFSPGNTNDRSAHLLWGESLVKDAGVTAYTVKFDFCFYAFGNNHVTSEIALMSDETTCTNKPNGNFKNNSTNCLFDLSEASSNTASATDRTFIINGDEGSTANLTQGIWYTVTLVVDTEAKTVDYNVCSLTGDAVASGIYEFPEDCNPWATGIYYLAGRYWNVGQFDKISIEAEVEGDIANVPSASLTGVNNAQRVYTINFMEGETLHVSFNGSEETVSYDDCEGVYVWSNNPNYDPSNEGLITDACNGGTLNIWTTIGDATSEVVAIEVENTIIPVVTATVDVVDVLEGYAKTYKITADNSTIPLSPQLFFNAEFIGDDGTHIQKNGLTNGATIELPSKGTLTITTQAFGYAEVSTTVENNIAYKQSKIIDFAHMTAAEITAAGFSEDGMVTGNFATYGRLFGYDASTYNAEDDTYTGKFVYSEIPQFTKLASEWETTENNVIVGDLAFTAVCPVNVHIYQGVGIVLEGKKGDDLSGSWISSLTMTVNGATENDIIKVSSMSNYGSTSLHPVVNNLDEYIASNNSPVTAVLKGTDQISLYRISDLIGCITVYSPENTGTGINNVESVESSEDAPIYTISGVRANKNNLKSGFYVQKGRTFIVK